MKRDGAKVTDGDSAKKAKSDEISATLGEILEINDMPTMSQGKWKNKTRCLIFGSRGLDYRTRHFMQDLRNIMPHTKADVKLEKKNDRAMIKEIAEMKNCSKVLYFEGRKKKDLYITVADVDEGPTIRFNVEGLNTMGELKFSGNCLKGSRPLLVFDEHFDSEPHYALIKEMFTQVFGTPRYHPKSQPFVDHVLNFSILDDRIWIRNYQIILEGTNKVKDEKFQPETVEIGPRLVLNLQRIQEGPFSGPAIYLNPDYVSPNERRRAQGYGQNGKSYMNKIIEREAKEEHKNNLPEVPKHVTDEIFVNN